MATGGGSRGWRCQAVGRLSRHPPEANRPSPPNHRMGITASIIPHAGAMQMLWIEMDRGWGRVPQKYLPYDNFVVGSVPYSFGIVNDGASPVEHKQFQKWHPGRRQDRLNPAQKRQARAVLPGAEDRPCPHCDTPGQFREVRQAASGVIRCYRCKGLQRDVQCSFQRPGRKDRRLTCGGCPAERLTIRASACRGNQLATPVPGHKGPTPRTRGHCRSRRTADETCFCGRQRPGGS